MKVYIVSEGNYSEYHVIGIYSLMENAEYAKKIYYADNDIQEMEMDFIPKHPYGLLLFHVAMDRDGNTNYVHREGCSVHREECSNYVEREWKPYGDNKHVSFTSWAKDEGHAIKIANEKRVMLIENGEWTTNFYAWRKKHESCN